MSSLDGERSPKRQRTSGSYSPASPPITAETKTAQRPFTPPPSVRMSPSWQSQSQTQHTSGSFPSPPSTAGFQSHMAGRGVGSDGGGESGRQTPASEGFPETRRDGDGDTDMSERRHDVDGDDVVRQAGHRRTDHERHQSSEDVATTTTAGKAPALHKLHITRKYLLSTA